MKRNVYALLASIVAATLMLPVRFVCGEQKEIVIKRKPLSVWIKQVKHSNRGLQMRAIRALREAPKDAYPQIIDSLIPILKSDRENDRFAAAQILGEYGAASRAAVASLVPLLKGTQYERNRAAAAKALGQILKDAEPCKEVDEVALALAAKFNDDYDTYSDVRRESVRALGMIGPAAKICIPKLTRALKDYKENSEEHSLVRQQAAWATGRMGVLAKEHIDQLISMLHTEGHRYPEIVEAIGRIGAVHKNVVPNIVDKMENRRRGDFPSLIASLKALGRLGPKSGEAVPLIQRMLDEMLQSSKPSVLFLQEACRTLGEIGVAAKKSLPVLKAISVMDFAAGSNASQEDQDKVHKLALEAIALINAG